LDKILTAQGIETTVISGEIAQNKREKALSEFRSSDKQSVAILSNVGERDLDIPEAELLVIFDLINTTKTVYQKLKRSRGGIVRVLFYQDTPEVRKVSSVMGKINEKYNWSSELLPFEYITI
jgi:superfamily II DNA/RNA helicase